MYDTVRTVAASTSTSASASATRAPQETRNPPDNGLGYLLCSISAPGKPININQGELFAVLPELMYNRLAPTWAEKRGTSHTIS